VPDSPAALRYQVRKGRLSVGERLLENLSTLGLDTLTLPDPAGVGPFTPTGVVVVRLREPLTEVADLCDLISVDLWALDVTTFEARWGIQRTRAQRESDRLSPPDPA
jgi:hypothetical protein